MPEPLSREAVLQVLARQLPDALLSDLFPKSDPAEIRRLIAPSLRIPAATRPSPGKPGGNEKSQGSCRLFTDGAARGNPGQAGAGVFLVDSQGRELASRAIYLGRCTNNEAEYRALVHGLRLALEQGCSSLQIMMDSELVVRQLQGRYKVKSPALQPLYREARELLAHFAAWQATHIPRAENRQADALANRAIDEQAA